MLTLALSAVVSSMAMNPAGAVALGVSINELQNFQVTSSSLGTLTLTDASRNSSNSVVFQGGISVAPNSVSAVLPGDTAAGLICSGPGCPAALTEIARADASASGDILSAFGSTMFTSAEAQRGTFGAASANGSDTLIGSLTLSAAGFITFSFSARRDLQASVSNIGDMASATIQDIFNISCGVNSPVGCSALANEDGVLFQFSPNGNALTGDDVNGNSATSVDSFNLNTTTSTNNPLNPRSFVNGFSPFSLTSNFELPTGIYSFSLSKSTQTNIFVAQQATQISEPGTVLLFGVGLAGLCCVRRRQPAFPAEKKFNSSKN